jgi:O-antigen biosynthesis protein
MYQLQPISQRLLLVLLRVYQIVQTEGIGRLLRKFLVVSFQFLVGNFQLVKRHWQPPELNAALTTDNCQLTTFPPTPQPPQILIVDRHLPTPDRDSGSLRQFNLMLVLQELGWKVTCAATNLAAPTASQSRLQQHGICCLARPAVRSLSHHLATHGNRYKLVILSRADVASALLPLIRHHCPTAKILFDTVDLHFLREARLAERTGSRINRWLAVLRQRQELALVAAADATLVVSPVELALLQAHHPPAQLYCISNIHHIYGSATPFATRRNLLFIGSFAHLPNADAVRWLLRDIMPLVWAILPDLHCQIIGADPPADLRALASAQVTIHGHVPEVQTFFAQCRLSVAPLRYGAGVKGKINQSLAHGLPVVATPIAAEGMFLLDNESVLIAETALEFAAAIVRLHTDPISWERLSRNGIAVMEQHFSVNAAKKVISEMIDFFE